MVLFTLPTRLMAMATQSFLPGAVFWDMDGTLVDTEPCWFAAEKRLVASFGGVWTDEDCMKLVGMHLPVGAQHLIDAGVQLSLEDTIDALLQDVCARARENLIVQPGAIELITEFAQAGIPQALVTMSDDPLVAMIIEAIEEIVGRPIFEVVVTGMEVEKGKPHPDAYLLAYERLTEHLKMEQRLVPELQHCLVVEDSIPGVAAGAASGMTTIAVPHAHPVSESSQYTLWDSLAGKTLTDVRHVCAARLDVTQPR